MSKIQLLKLITVPFVMITMQSFALDFELEKTSYAHLYEVNKEWKDHKDVAPNLLVDFQNDIERISYHINLVEQELRTNIPTGISGNALKNRLALLKELDKYGDDMIFPTNLYHSERTPYFIDDFGVHCAVGFLIMKSGRSDLSNKIIY